MFAKIKHWIMHPFTYRKRKQEEEKEKQEAEERLVKRLEELRKRDPFIYE